MTVDDVFNPLAIVEMTPTRNMTFGYNDAPFWYTTILDDRLLINEIQNPYIHHTVVVSGQGCRMQYLLTFAARSVFSAVVAGASTSLGAASAGPTWPAVNTSRRLLSPRLGLRLHLVVGKDNISQTEML
ncbi:hypothetical protein EVAR_54915_1 [Eumeta japonica]|uniref:Uncharacterized protein n=1 Tax=Eumeta variegata TaxID=151549 RepID=A0A4C1YXQ8_EUMVA|nr:hypothetical protein EVAR_54915_1 [Eumeta japonica]